MRRFNLSLILLLMVSSLLLMLLRLPRPQGPRPRPEIGEISIPQPFGSWDGVRSFLVEPGKAYLIPVRCKLVREESLEAARSVAAGEPLEHELVANPWASAGVHTVMVETEIKRVRHRVWQIHGGGVIGLLSRKDGLTAEEAGRLSREEIVERYNRRQRHRYDRHQRQGQTLELADVYKFTVTNTELHADVVLYLPQELPQTGPLRSVSEHAGTKIYSSQYGQRVLYKLPALPKEEIDVRYFSAQGGRFIVRTGGYAGKC